MGTAASSPINADILRPPAGYVLQAPLTSPAAPHDPAIGTTGFTGAGLGSHGAEGHRIAEPVMNKIEHGLASHGQGNVCEKRARVVIEEEGLGPDDGPSRKRRLKDGHGMMAEASVEGATCLGGLSQGNLACSGEVSDGISGTAAPTLHVHVPPGTTDVGVSVATNAGVTIVHDTNANVAAAADAAAAAAAIVAADVAVAANDVDAAFMSFPTTPAGEVAMPASANVGVDGVGAHHAAAGDMAVFPGVSGMLGGVSTTMPVAGAVGIAPPPPSMSTLGISESPGVPGASPFTAMNGVLPASYNFLPFSLLNAAAVPPADKIASAAVSAAVNAGANAVFVNQSFPVAVSSVNVGPELATLGPKETITPATNSPEIPTSSLTQFVGASTSRSSGHRRKNSESQDGETPRRNRSRPTCTAEGCQQRPLFGIEGTKQAIFCSHHKAPGMTNVLCRRCEVEGCKHQPSFAVEGSRAVRCATHKTADMVNVAAPRCKSPGCMVCPSFGRQGERKASFCATHRREGDVDLVTRRCHHEGCVHRPVFGLPPEKKAYYCAAHKLEGMVNVFAPRCAFPECTHQPSYGPPGSKRSTHCGKHRLQFHENKR